MAAALLEDLDCVQMAAALLPTKNHLAESSFAQHLQKLEVLKCHFPVARGLLNLSSLGEDRLKRIVLLPSLLLQFLPKHPISRSLLQSSFHPLNGLKPGCSLCRSLDVEHPLHHGCHLETTDEESERFWSIRSHDLASFHCEVVEWVCQLFLLAWLVLETDELAVFFEYEVSLPPVLYVLASLEEFALLDNRRTSPTPTSASSSFSHIRQSQSFNSSTSLALSRSLTISDNPNLNFSTSLALSISTLGTLSKSPPIFYSPTLLQLLALLTHTSTNSPTLFFSSIFSSISILEIIPSSSA